MKTRPEAAWDALLKEILTGDSKKIWQGEHIENLSADERKLILPIMKNYIENYAPSGEFEKSKVRVLVGGNLQDFVRETQGPVTEVESILIVVSIAIFYDLEIFKIDITSAYHNTPMNDDVEHKWLLLDKDVASVLISMEPTTGELILEEMGRYWCDWTRSCTALKRLRIGETRP